jgi:hypothetical protein
MATPKNLAQHYSGLIEEVVRETSALDEVDYQISALAMPLPNGGMNIGWMIVMTAQSFILNQRVASSAIMPTLEPSDEEFRSAIREMLAELVKERMGSLGQAEPVGQQVNGSSGLILPG